MMHSLGYVIDHPLAVAARTSPRNWSALLLVPIAVPVPDDFDEDLGPVLDQDGIGACVAFSAASVRSWQEWYDEGRWAFNNASAFLGYDWLKHGHGAYPGDGVDAEGSYPLAVWTLAKVEGLPGADGLARKIAAYYQLQGAPGSAAWIDLQIQVLLQYGPVTVSSAWPNNWWTCPSSGLLPYPSGHAGGHQYVRKGFWLKGPVGPLASGLSPSGRYWRHRQSWGAYGRTDKFGRSGEFLTPFEADAAYPNLQIGEVWKTLDIIDYPKPEPAMTLPIYNAAPFDQRVDLAAGTQLYATDGTTPLVKIGLAGAWGVRSPFAVSATKRLVRITTLGITQGAIVATAACSNMAPFAPSDTTHVVTVSVDDGRPPLVLEV
jgi:hypothetical protein